MAGVRMWATAVLTVGALLLWVACTEAPEERPADAPPATADAPTEASAGGPSEARTSSEVEPVEALPLTVARRIDGDSFVASDGVEYRVGMVNTPERGECGADQAAARTYDLLDRGFAADAYSRDGNGRSVARIMTAEGDLGVTLAREGLADDRYLTQFRHENPPYASALEDAFAAARDSRAGLHGSCWADGVTGPDRGGAQGGTSAPQPLVADEAAGTPASHAGRAGEWACHPAYVECLPDGPDLDCAEVAHQVVLTGPDDPFRLDGITTTATDGIGCDTYPAWSEEEPYPYYR